MALAKQSKNDKKQVSRKISTDAIGYQYLYRQITMTNDESIIDTDMNGETVETHRPDFKPTITLDEVLLWEATQRGLLFFQFHKLFSQIIS